MSILPTQRDPLDFTARPEVWTPAGTTGEAMAARVVASGDFVLVHKAHGVWSLTHANPDMTQRYSIWAKVVCRVRRTFTVRIDGEDWPVNVHRLDDKVVRGTGDLAAGLAPETLEAFDRAAKANREILTLAASGRADAVDLALECAFPSGQGVNPLAAPYSRAQAELETIRDKVNGHLETVRDTSQQVKNAAFAQDWTENPGAEQTYHIHRARMELAAELLGLISTL